MHADRRRVLWIVPLTFMIVLLLGASSPTLVQHSPEPTRLIVTFHEGAPVHVGERYHGAPVVLADPTLRFAVVESIDADAFAALARRDPQVREVAPDVSFELFSWVPDDPLFVSQHGPRQVGAPEAWEMARAGSGRDVCIIDTGLHRAHEDLDAQRWQGGWDFIEDDADPQDANGHGTHVAGTAIASVDNGIGIAGIGDLDYRVVRAGDHRIWVSAAAAGLRWCADEGIGIISMSFGSPVPHDLLREGVAYASAAGSLLLGAAGNSDCDDCVIYPARWPEVLAVACVDAAERPCRTGSNRGPEIALAAPGHMILSTSIRGVDCYLHYCVRSGTSMSTPHVAGVAGLVWNLEPDLPAEAVRDLLMESARDVEQPGRDNATGTGLVQAHAALGELWPLRRPVCRILEPPAFEPVTGALHVEAWAKSRGSQVLQVALRIDGGPQIPLSTAGAHLYALDVEALAPGEHELALSCLEVDGDARTHVRTIMVE